MSTAEAFFTDAYFGRFITQKYQNPNPLQRRQIRRLLGRVVDLGRPLKPRTIIDAGAGEGFLTGYLVHEFPSAQITAVDSSSEDLKRLQQLFPTVATVVADVETFDLGPRFDLLVATEVLEHLPHPERGLARFASQAKTVIVTVPNEPLFRLINFLRGKNVTRFGNDPEHFNHWSPFSLRRFLGQSLTVERVETVFPWIVAAGHR